MDLQMRMAGPGQRPRREGQVFEYFGEARRVVEAASSDVFHRPYIDSSGSTVGEVHIRSASNLHTASESAVGFVAQRNAASSESLRPGKVAGGDCLDKVRNRADKSGDVRNIRVPRQ
jgi:hypothetical protein